MLKLIVKTLRFQPKLQQFQIVCGYKILWAISLLSHILRPWLWFNLARGTLHLAPWLDSEINVHRVKRYWQESYARPRYRSRSCPNRAWYKPYLDLGRDAVNEPECKKSKIYALTPSSWQAFDVTGSVKAWAEGAPNYWVLIKVHDETTEGVDLRFWNRPQ